MTKTNSPDTLVPLCECHGLPKVWRTDKRRSKGGYFACHASVKKAHSDYNRSEKGKGRQTTYAKTDKGKKMRQRYNRGEAAKAAKKKFENRSVRIQVVGQRQTIKVADPQAKHDMMQKIDEFKSRQKQEYREEFMNGRIDETE